MLLNPIWIRVQMGLGNINVINQCVYIKYCLLELSYCHKNLFVCYADGLKFIKTLTHSCYQKASQQRAIVMLAIGNCRTIGQSGSPPEHTLRVVTLWYTANALKPLDIHLQVESVVIQAEMSIHFHLKL